MTVQNMIVLYESESICYKIGQSLVKILESTNIMSKT